jgi:hypothetical protein
MAVENILEPFAVSVPYPKKGEPHPFVSTFILRMPSDYTANPEETLSDFLTWLSRRGLSTCYPADNHEQRNTAVVIIESLLTNIKAVKTELETLRINVNVQNVLSKCCFYVESSLREYKFTGQNAEFFT